MFENYELKGEPLNFFVKFLKSESDCQVLIDWIANEDINKRIEYFDSPKEHISDIYSKRYSLALNTNPESLLLEDLKNLLVNLEKANIDAIRLVFFTNIQADFYVFTDVKFTDIFGVLDFRLLHSQAPTSL